MKNLFQLFDITVLTDSAISSPKYRGSLLSILLWTQKEGMPNRWGYINRDYVISQQEGKPEPNPLIHKYYQSLFMSLLRPWADVFVVEILHVP